MKRILRSKASTLFTLKQHFRGHVKSNEKHFLSIQLRFEMQTSSSELPLSNARIFTYTYQLNVMKRIICTEIKTRPNLQQSQATVPMIICFFLAMWPLLNQSSRHLPHALYLQYLSRLFKTRNITIPMGIVWQTGVLRPPLVLGAFTLDPAPCLRNQHPLIDIHLHYKWFLFHPLLFLSPYLPEILSVFLE